VIAEFNAGDSETAALSRIKRWATARDDIHAVILVHKGGAAASLGPVDVIPIETIVKETTKPRVPRTQQSDTVRYMHVKRINAARMYLSALPSTKLIAESLTGIEVFYTTNSETLYPLTPKWTIKLDSGQQIDVHPSWSNINNLFKDATNGTRLYLIKPSHVKQIEKKPNWHPLNEYGPFIQEEIDKLKITRDELQAAALRGLLSSSNKLNELCEVLSLPELSEVDDQDFVHLMGTLKKLYHTPVRSEVKHLAGWATIPVDFVGEIRNAYNDMVVQYPLLQYVELSKYSIKDVVNYINTVYTSKQ
jgi:hypothetical protein